MSKISPFMKNLYLFLIIIILKFVPGFSQPCFVQLDNATGLYASADYNLLESLSCDIRDLTNPEFVACDAGSFSFFSQYSSDDNFILDQTYTQFNIPENNFLTFVRITDEKGNLIDIHFDLNFTMTSVSDCIDNNSELMSILKELVRSKFKETLQQDSYATAQVQSLTYLRDIIQDLLNCCQSSDDIECVSNLISSNDILKDLYERGYGGYPIVVNKVPTASKEKSENKLTGCNIYNFNTWEFDIADISDCNIVDNICDFVGDFEELSHLIYITNDETYNSHKEQMFNDINSGGYDIAIHFHISEGSISVEPSILVYDYSITDIHWSHEFNYSAGEWDPNNWYTIVQFAGSTPITKCDVPEVPGYWRQIVTWGNPPHIFKAHSLANERGIPFGDIYTYNFTNESEGWFSTIYEQVLGLSPWGYYVPDGPEFRAIFLYEDDPLNPKMHVFTDGHHQGSSNIFGDDLGLSSTFNSGQTIDAEWSLDITIDEDL